MEHTVALRRTTLPAAPAWCDADEADLWTAVVSEYELATDELRMLELALNAWRRWRQAREQLDASTLTEPGRWGDRVNPLVKVELDSRTSALRAWRELNLSGAPLPTPKVRR